MKRFQYGCLQMEVGDADTYCVVADCDKKATAVEIPAEVEGVPVVGVADHAFENCTELVSVTFAEGLKQPPKEGEEGFYIGTRAFAECTALPEIVIPEGVTAMGHGAFQCCTALERVQMPDCCCEPYVFYRCEKLKEITPITDIGEGMFSHCKSLTTFPVAPGSWIIGEDAFEHCYALTEITIPASVKRIEQLAFRNCRGLKRVTFEHTEGWKWKSMYGFSKEPDRSWDVSDPERNAHSLAGEDFDDGVTCRYRD